MARPTGPAPIVYRATRTFDVGHYRDFWSAIDTESLADFQMLAVEFQQGLTQPELARIIEAVSPLPDSLGSHVLGDINVANPFVTAIAARNLWIHHIRNPTLHLRIHDAPEHFVSEAHLRDMLDDEDRWRNFMLSRRFRERENGYLGEMILVERSAGRRPASGKAFRDIDPREILFNECGPHVADWTKDPTTATLESNRRNQTSYHEQWPKFAWHRYHRFDVYLDDGFSQVSYNLIVRLIEKRMAFRVMWPFAMTEDAAERAFALALGRAVPSADSATRAASEVVLRRLLDSSIRLPAALLARLCERFPSAALDARVLARAISIGAPEIVEDGARRARRRKERRDFGTAAFGFLVQSFDTRALTGATAIDWNRTSP